MDIKRFPKPSLSPQQAGRVFRSVSRRKSLIAKSNDAAELQGIKPNLAIKEVFHPNDIRGVYGKILNDDFAYKLGRAIGTYLKCKKIIIGRDMRVSSPKIFNFLSKGLIESGTSIIDIGLVDTPSIYFATGHYNLPGIMITASHNPTEYNGIKIVRAKARPIDAYHGFKEIIEIIEKNSFSNSKKVGKIIKNNLNEEYGKYVLSFIDKRKINNLNIIADAGNGMASLIIPKVFKKINVKLSKLYFDLDGSFPNHVPNPILKENIKTLEKKVVKDKADFGIAFDGDMDRVVFVDENGMTVNASFIGALLAKKMLSRERKQGVVYSSATSRIVRETILKYGGKPIREKVGHSFIKSRMLESDAVFVIEHSGHYYYRDNYYADSGLITALIILEIYSDAKKRGMKFSDLVREFEEYSQADEISIKLKNEKDIIGSIEKYYINKKPKKSDHFDGLFMEFEDYWFCARRSNTEPLLRINLEARNKGVLKEKVKEILKLIKK